MLLDNGMFLIMFINKYIKKIILVLLLLALPVQAMSVLLWPSVITLKRKFKKNKTIIICIPYGYLAQAYPPPAFKQLSFSSFKQLPLKTVIKSIAVLALYYVFSAILIDCIELIWEKAEEKQKRPLLKQKRELFRKEMRKIEEMQSKESKEAKEDRIKKINDEIDRQCVICKEDENESGKKLLQEIICPSGVVHPNKIHEKCLNRALRINPDKCAYCNNNFWQNWIRNRRRDLGGQRLPERRERRNLQESPLQRERSVAVSCLG